MDLLPCSQATLEGMAEPAEPVDLSATAAMGDLAAMAQSARREAQVSIREIQAQTAAAAEPAAMAAQVELVEQFQAMAVMVASRAKVAPEVPVAMGPQVPMVWMLQWVWLQPAEMVAWVEMARPAAMAGLAEWEVRPSMVSQAQPEPMAMEATGALQAAAVQVVMVAMVRAELLFHF